MTQALTLALLIALAAPVVAQAQTVPPPVRPGQAPFDGNRYQADQNRLEMERLRVQADQREAFARQLEADARQRSERLQAARQAEPIPPPASHHLRSPQEERAARQAATARRQAVAAGVGQIDAWLDRPSP